MNISLSPINNGCDEMNNKASMIEDILRGKNFKLTSSRKEIIRIFLGSDQHLKPEDVYELVKAKGISLPTVYRTIDILKKNQIIEEIAIGKHRYYELKIFSGKKLHIHFKCDVCGEIFDIDDQKLVMDLIDITSNVESEYKVEVEDLIMVLHGICEKCKSRRII